MGAKRLSIYLAAASVLALSACSSNRVAIPQAAYASTYASPAVARPVQPQRVYVIQPGDHLDIKFYYNPELNESVVVRPDGKISLQLVDDIEAADRTPAQLDEFLTQQYAQELKNPKVTVIVRSFAGQRVYVGGEVGRQEIVELTSGMSALQAVFKAGGFKETAKPEGTIVVRKGLNNEPIPIRIDLDQARYGGQGADFILQPNDVIYVPKTFIAKADQFVNQYIERLLLFKGINLGFSYELHDAGPSD